MDEDEVIETGINMPPEHDLTALHWFNIPELPTKQSTETNLYMNALRDLSSNPELPLYLYMVNSHIADLDRINHSDAAIELMNRSGVHIYLYEPICGYLVDKRPKGALFYTEFPSDIDHAELRAIELDSIRDYAIRNRLTSITVHTCEYNIQSFFQYYLPQMNLICDDILLHSYTVFSNIQTSLSRDFTKKFICTNWRFTSVRNMVVAYICRMPVHLSWNYCTTQESLLEGLWCDLASFDDYPAVVGNLPYLVETVPIKVDRLVLEATWVEHRYSYRYPEPDYVIPSDGMNTDLEKYYRDAFVSIVTESRYAQPTANFSEKTFKAILHRKPFIVVAPPKTLEYIRAEGFRTFDSFWDESYDECLNHEDRLKKIFDLIDWINNKPLSELRLMYDSMAETMEFNFNTLVNKTPYKKIQQL